MGNIKIIRGVFDTKLELQHAGVKAGFPSPAEDYIHETLDFNRDYIRHPEASFYGDIEGDSMKDAGIFDGDRVIIDRAVEPHNGSIVVAFWNGEFTIKYLDLTHKSEGYIELRPANPDYPVFRIEAGDDFLRTQKTVATIVGVFVNTNAFREDLAQYWNFQELRLVTPTSSTIPIVQAAHDVLDRIFIQGYQYKKAGVIVMGISPDSPIQQDLFDLNAEQIQKMHRLDEVVDRINRMNGSETIVIGAQQYTRKGGKDKAAIEREKSRACTSSSEREQARPKVKADVFANAIKHDFRSKNPTTRWSDIIKLR